MSAVVVNGERIEEAALQAETAAMFKLMAERMPKEPRATLQARAREWSEENLIEAVLLRQAAMSDGEPLEVPAGCSAEQEAQLRLERLLARITAPASPPKHKEIVAFYVKNRESLHEGEKVRAAQIVRNVDERNSEESARAAIEQARDALAQGRAFGEVADEMSDCPGNGGDLGYFARGVMVPAFDEVVFRLQAGEVSGIFRTEFGFHIAKMLDRKEGGIPKLEEVEGRIAEHLLAEKKQKRVHQYVDHLRAKAVIGREVA